MSEILDKIFKSAILSHRSSNIASVPIRAHPPRYYRGCSDGDGKYVL